MIIIHYIHVKHKNLKISVHKLVIYLLLTFLRFYLISVIIVYIIQELFASRASRVLFLLCHCAYLHITKKKKAASYDINF